MNGRTYWEEYFQERGARIGKTTTKQTDLVIVGEEPGDIKIQKARQYGVPTVSWIMFNYLGMMETRGPYRLRHIPKDFVQAIVIAMVSNAELLYAKAVRHPESNERWEAFCKSATAVEVLLRAAWGNPGCVDSGTADGDNSGASLDV